MLALPTATSMPSVTSLYRSSLPDARTLDRMSVREASHLLEGLHASPNSPLLQNIQDSVPELSSLGNWYKPPRGLSNGHVQTIAAAKLRRTRAVKYYRDLVTTPDGGTLAVDILAGLQRKVNRDPSSRWSSMLAGGAVAGASEDAKRRDTLFVDEPPPVDPTRPLLLLTSGLGGGSQDTYVRSMAATAAERGWQVAVVNMRACGDSPVTSPRMFSAYRGANDDLRFVVQHLRETRLDGAACGTPVAVIGWSNSGTILNNVLAEQATTHKPDGSEAGGASQTSIIDAGAALATPFDMPSSITHLETQLWHSNVYDRNLGASLRNLWVSARPQFIDPTTDAPRPVPLWDGLGEDAGTFLVDDHLCRTATSIRQLDEGVTRRQYGYASVDEYYENASSDQRLGMVETPLLCLNAYDDPIAPGASLIRALRNARDNPNVLLGITAHGGHLGWCERGDPWGGSTWVERATCGFLESALGVVPTEECDQLSCTVFD